MANQPTIADILAEARKGKAVVAGPSGVTAHIRPDGPGRWIVTLMGKHRGLLSRTDEELRALLIRWGYKED